MNNMNSKKAGAALLMCFAALAGCAEQGSLQPAAVAALNKTTSGANLQSLETSLTQTCNYTITADTVQLNARSSSDFPNELPQAGDVFCIEAGTQARKPLVLKSFEGAAGNPIVFRNNGGQVIIDGDLTSGSEGGLIFYNSRHIRLTGSGHVDHTYGIIVKNTDSKGVKFTARPSGVEIDHVQIENVGSGLSTGIGISINPHSTCTDGSNNAFDYDADGEANDLDDVDCGNNPYDTNPICANPHTNQDILIHHNVIKNVTTEGMYIGNSHFQIGTDVTKCGPGQNQTQHVYHALTKNVQIYNNQVEDTGLDGIQVGSAVENCNIHHNTVLRDSYRDESSQRTGILNNRGSSCHVFNNFVKDGKGSGITLYGNGGNLVYNNIVVNAGHTSTTFGSGASSFGIKVSKGSNGGFHGEQNVQVYNNTVLGGRDGSVNFSHHYGDDNQLYNNMLLSPFEDSSYISHSGDGILSIHSNLKLDKLDAKLLDPDTSPAALDPANYCPTNGSPAVNVGADTPATTDYFGKTRNTPDVGACEYAGQTTVLKIPVNAEFNTSEQEHNGRNKLNRKDIRMMHNRTHAGIRFTNLPIPTGMRITNAYIKFMVKHRRSDPTSLNIRAQANGNAPAFTTEDNYLGSRPLSVATVNWQPEEWTKDDRYTIKTTNDISSVVQEIVSRSDWTQNNSLALIIDGYGRRRAFSYDSNHPERAPVLHIEFEPMPQTTSLDYKVIHNKDDAKENSLGNVNLYSANLDMMKNQTHVGLRFRDLGIPQGAQITTAYLKFTVREENLNGADLNIFAQDIGDAPIFTSSPKYDVSNRAKTTQSVNWIPTPWTAAEIGGVKTTPDISSLVQAIVDRSDWVAFNHMALIISGSGTRIAEAYQTATPGNAPTLHVEYSLPAE